MRPSLKHEALIETRAPEPFGAVARPVGTYSHSIVDGGLDEMS
jgi:hypothetical protein